MSAAPRHPAHEGAKWWETACPDKLNRQAGSLFARYPIKTPTMITFSFMQWRRDFHATHWAHNK
eukprot:10825646-Alexandrium_andersonii.AAC.1